MLWPLVGQEQAFGAGVHNPCHLSLIGNSIDFSFARRTSHSSVKLTITASANVQCDWRQLNTAINGDVTESEKFAQTLDTKNGLETVGNSAA